MQTNIFTIFTTTHDKNLAYHVTKDKVQVDIARKNLSIKHNFDIKSLKYMDQVHGNDVKIVKKDQNLYKCDALVTNLKNTPLMVMVADCIPILFEDKTTNTIAVAHAGRNGTFLNISSNVINTMVTYFNCDTNNIKVELGASIQKCCYEVSNEMVNIVEKNFSSDFTNGRYIDLQAINKMQLIDCGIKEQNISISNICTKCSNEPYFSYRKDSSCGRFAGIIMLKD
jgi:YfiH family protein